MPRSLVNAIKECVRAHLVPERSLRRSVLHYGWIAWERGLRLDRFFKPPVIARPLDIYNREELRSFVGASTAHLDHWTSQDAEIDEAGAVRFILGVLRDSSLFRLIFPQAISAGETGAYCRWLCGRGAEQYGLSARAIKHVQSAFRLRPGDRVRHLFDHRRDLRMDFPLALTPAGRRLFLRWLMQQGKKRYGLRDEEIGWFLHECAEDPAQGVAATFLRTPDWQKRFPHGLTVFGQQDLIHWLRQQYQIHDDWIERVVLPPLYPPSDELRLLHASSSELQEFAPRAFHRQQETDRLVHWLRNRGRQQLALDESWLHRFDQDLANGTIDQRGVNVLGYFCHPGEVGQNSRSTVQAFQSSGLRVSCRDIPCDLMRDDPHRSEYLGLELFDYSIVPVAPGTDVKALYAESGLAMRPGVYRIGQWPSAFTQAPAGRMKWTTDIQEIWAPTPGIASALRAVLSIPVFELPRVEDLARRLEDIRTSRKRSSKAGEAA